MSEINSENRKFTRNMEVFVWEVDSENMIAAGECGWRNESEDMNEINSKHLIVG